LPPIPLSDSDVAYINQFDSTFGDQMIYRTYKYPQANRVSFHSATNPIDVVNDDADFLSIDNFFELLPVSIQQVFENYFTDKFYQIATHPEVRGIRLYLNKPNAKGVHIHKDIYSGGGTPRQVAINIPISDNSLTSDLNFYDDELKLIHTVNYQYTTPLVLNTSVFHEVVHNDHSTVRKIITISTKYHMSEFLDLVSQGNIVRK
jgi:hypothetical protein